MALVHSVLLVDDHQGIRAALRELIDLMTDVEVVGEAADGTEAVHLVEILRPDLVIMDVQMPPLDGIDATRVIKERFPSVRVIGHTAYAESDMSRILFEAGAEDVVAKGSLDIGYLLKLWA